MSKPRTGRNYDDTFKNEIYILECSQIKLNLNICQCAALHSCSSLLSFSLVRFVLLSSILVFVSNSNVCYLNLKLKFLVFAAAAKMLFILFSFPFKRVSTPCSEFTLVSLFCGMNLGWVDGFFTDIVVAS